MPKRFGKRETWRRKTLEKLCPPEVRALHRAMYDPHFKRAFFAWGRCRKAADGMIENHWIDQVEYCLDRTEL
jgi:hypothetical protein